MLGFEDDQMEEITVTFTNNAKVKLFCLLPFNTIGQNKKQGEGAALQAAADIYIYYERFTFTVEASSQVEDVFDSDVAKSISDDIISQLTSASYCTPAIDRLEKMGFKFENTLKPVQPFPMSLSYDTNRDLYYMELTHDDRLTAFQRQKLPAFKLTKMRFNRDNCFSFPETVFVTRGKTLESQTYYGNKKGRQFEVSLGLFLRNSSNSYFLRENCGGVISKALLLMYTGSKIKTWRGDMIRLDPVTGLTMYFDRIHSPSEPVQDPHALGLRFRCLLQLVKN